jgi:hypothetical protein
MNKKHLCWVFVILFIFVYPIKGKTQAVQKVGGVMISVDDSPSDAVGVSNWESFRQLFNSYGYKMNIGLQSENLNIPVVASKVKDLINDGHEMLDHCPQDDIVHFIFSTHLEDYDLYKNNPGVASATLNGNLCSVTLKSANNILDTAAISVLAERTRLLYRRYLGSGIPYPKILAQPGDLNYIARSTGYIYLNKAGYTGTSYDGAAPEGVEVKTYCTPTEKHARYAFKRGDLTDLGNLAALKKQIADDYAKHKVTSILTHFDKIPGILTQTKTFLDWIKAKNISIRTASQWLAALYDTIPNPGVNVMPGLINDLDEDGTPDGYYFYQNQSKVYIDQTAPGGIYISRNVLGNFFEMTDLGGIEKGLNSFSFSAKGEVGATIGLQLTSNGQTYFNNTLTLDSPDWKTYKFDVTVPQNSVLSSIALSLNQTKTSGAVVLVSNLNLVRTIKKAQNKLQDITIKITDKTTLIADPGCTNYNWSSGEKTQAITIDGSKKGPGKFLYWYTAVDNTGILISDSAYVTINGLIASPSSLSFPAKNATASLQITSTIPWSITTNSNLAKPNLTNGTGNATITVTMADNNTVDAIKDVINIISNQGTISIPVSQIGVDPMISIDKTPLNEKAPGSIEQVQLTSNTQWSISKLPSWLNCTPLLGKGNTALSVTIVQNLMAIARTDTIIFKTLNGPTFFLIVNQTGADPVLTIDKTSIIAKSTAKTDSIQVMSNAAWTISGLASWITSDKTSGTGNSKIHLSIAANSTINDRTDTFKIGVLNGPSGSITVQQAGADYVAVDKSVISCPAAGQTDTVKVTSNVDWVVSTKASWITATPLNGSKNQSIILTLATNPKAESRKDTLFVTGTNLAPVSIVVTEAAATPTISVTPTTISSIYSGKIIPLQITSNGAWTTTDTPTWASLKATKGTGDLVDTLVIQKNKLLTDRTGKITFTLKNNSTLTVNITQTAAPLYIDPTPTSISLGPNSGDSINLSISSNTSWKIISAPFWLKFNLDSYVAFVGDTIIKLKLTTDGAIGEDQTGTFNIQEVTTATNKINLAIPVTLRMFPGVLTVPVDTIKFSSNINETKTISILSNLGWSATATDPANWLKITPSYSTIGNADLRFDCITANAGAKDRQVNVLIQQSKGIVSKSIVIIQSGTHVGIIDDYEKSGIKIYPQPTHDLLNIDLPVNHTFKYWEIYNVSGMKLLKGKIEFTDKIQIALPHFNPGVYFIKLLSDTGSSGFKFTIN